MARRAKVRQTRTQTVKPRKHETLEARVVMSADPFLGGPLLNVHESPIVEVPVVTPHELGPAVELPMMNQPQGQPDFWIDPAVSAELALDEIDRMVDTMLREGHQLTGQDNVVERYGFTGAGQTVAVIDTGIAYNHYALGGGTGSGYRIVGGYDFAEGDADFNDDSGNSKAGHGTHVAGIIGASSDGPHNGVATGVDLVGLRVFDDAGAGYFSWIEKSLQWVQANLDTFENPITAVNMSLGTTWNSDNNPGWAMLEDEFAALEAAGVFISVSAGNSYEDYNTNGVSYPASSDHVIPVMATRDNGDLAYFSQRATYAIGAPGWAITSTVPDHNANDADNLDDDWGVKYGTSMAAPYVAGASVLVREAMEFVGQTGIDQWDIYDHLMATGDSFFDSASQQTYKRLNLEAAIDALMPADDHGTSVSTASNLGTLGAGTSSTSGVISTLDDADYFTFTAGVSGLVTVTAENTTHDLVASWDTLGGAWTSQDGAHQIDVVAGQTYSIALGSSGGLGYYDLAVEVEEAAMAPVDWGVSGVQQTRSWTSTSNEEWFSVTASRAGYFTAEAIAASGSANVAIYDTQQNLLAAAGSRADVQATAGQTLLLRVTGDATAYDVRTTNALSVSGGVATLVGTSNDDSIGFAAGEGSHEVTLNGVAYTLSDAATINIHAGAGVDALQYDGSSTADTIEAGGESFTASSAGHTLSVAGIESTKAYGGSEDTVRFQDTASNDHFRGKQTFSEITGGGVTHFAAGFGAVDARSDNGGVDVAEAYDSAGDDRFYGKTGASILTGAGFSFDMRGFDKVYAYSLAGGHDTAELYDSPDSDVLISRADTSFMRNATSLNYAMSFDQVYAYSFAGGQDSAHLFDSSGDDVFIGRSDYSLMRGAAFDNNAYGFDVVKAYATAGGTDLAFLYGTVADDLLFTNANQTSLYGSGYTADAVGFAKTRVWGGGGVDRAVFKTLSEGDAFFGSGALASLDLGGRRTQANDFDRVTATIDSSASVDIALGEIDYAFEQLGE